jgi:HEAT repeat protein
VPLDDLTQVVLDAIVAGDDEACEAAVQAFARRPRLLPALRPLLASSDPDERWWAVRGLALIGGEEAAGLLISALGDADEATRCAAALGLGQNGSTASVPALAERLADPSGWVRDSAADALAMIGEPAAPALVAALRDAPDGVRVRAASALRRIVTRAERSRIRPDMDMQSPLGQAVGALFRALQDPNYLVRQHAYAALDGLGLLDNLIVM